MAPPHDELRRWLETNLPDGAGKSCLEVGCFPGRYLAVLGEMHYELHGVDLTPRVSEIKYWLDSRGYNTGGFEHADFLKYNNSQSYDLVCSFGFIEHFTNWEEVLLRHAELVKEGGKLVIETPNFRGFLQNLLHRTLDATNYKRHYIPAMQPLKWKAILEDRGFQVERCEYFGKFEFWSDAGERGFFGKVGMKLLSFFQTSLQKRKPGSASISPYCGIIAIKKTT
jgi:L-malate glycosyltransferase